MVQLRLATELTSEEYVRQEAWRAATLPLCPKHPEGGCGFSRHGTYARKDPAGCRIARWYCRKGHCTFSLLPQFLAAKFPGELDEVEQVALAREQAGSIEAAAEQLRPEIEVPGGVRWVGRRSRLVTAALAAVLGLLPDLAGCEPTVQSLRDRLRAAPVLVVLRSLADEHLHALPPPLGFGPRPLRRRRVRPASQQNPGPDPPAKAR